jgi:hypothetical protein
MSNIDEIKKALYKQKPRACIKGMKDGKLWYRAVINKGFVESNVEFLIPKDEGNDFDDCEPAQLLIRWIYKQ